MGMGNGIDHGFRYQATARSQGLKTLLFGGALLAVCAVLCWLIWDAREISPGSVAVFVAAALFGLAGGIMFLMSLVRVVLGGRWDIRVSSAEGVVWDAPPFSDEPFRFALDEVDRVEKRITERHRKDGSVKRKEKWYLVKGGEDYWLSDQSGVDLAEFVAALEGLGVERVEVRVPRK